MATIVAALALVLTLSPIQLRAAEVANGEAMSLAGYELVLCTMRNRLESPDFPNSLSGVLRAYYARPRLLSRTDREIAVAVFSGAQRCPPYYWAMSKQDKARRGFATGDLVIRYTRNLELHFYERSPFTRTSHTRSRRRYGKRLLSPRLNFQSLH